MKTRKGSAISSSASPHPRIDPGVCISDEIRGKFKEKLTTIIDNHYKTYISTREYNKIKDGLIAEIGESLYKYCHDNENLTDIEKLDVYVQIARCILMNLDTDSHVHNDYLLDRVLRKKIRPRDLVDMKAHEMCPDKWKDIYDAIMNQTNIEQRKNMSMTTSQKFQCPKCSERKCTYYELQTRSADEPSTIFISCTVCNFRWRTE